MKNTRLAIRLILGALVLVISLMAVPAAGASDRPLTIKTMRLSIWPEYDDPRVLVIYQGEFSDGSTFPQQVDFPAPMGSEISQVCALKQPGDEHLCQLYDTLSEQGGIGVSYKLPIPTYFLEYYWDGITGQPNKAVNFKYTSPYAIDRLDVDVAQPVRATDFKMTPAYATVTSDSTGVKYYHYTFNNVTPGQVIAVDASYTKSDNKPSVAKKSSTGSTGGGTSPTTLILIASAIVVVAIIGFLAFRRKPAPAVARAQRRRAAMAETNRHNMQASRQAAPPRQTTADNRQTQGGKAATFCNKCGMKLEPDDAFCPGCGAKPRGRP